LQILIPDWNKPHWKYVEIQVTGAFFIFHFLEKKHIFGLRDCKYFLSFFRSEVKMMLFKKHFLSFIILSLLCLATGVLANENVDCINYTDSPDVRCKYYRIWNVRGSQLYVVPPDSALIKKNAIKGASFYIYAPQEKSVGRDTLSLFLASDSSDVFNLYYI